MPAKRVTPVSPCTPTFGPHWRCRSVTEGLGRDSRVTNVAYRLRKPVYAPAELAYSARVTAVDGDHMTLELIEQHPGGEVGFEGTVCVTRTPAATS